MNYYISFIINWFKRKDPIYESFMVDGYILDVGCGEGNILRHDTNRIYGIDNNEDTIERLKKEKLLVQKADATRLPFENDFFSVVNCSHVIEHLFPADAYKMMKEMGRVLKPGGKIILISPMPSVIWNSFGHIKPYPPVAIGKLFREVSLESFNCIGGLKIEWTFYFGNWSRNKVTFLISTVLAQFINSCRGSYLVVIRKNEK